MTIVMIEMTPSIRDGEEICDDVDNNCDGFIDEDTATDALTWFADTDDGYLWRSKQYDPRL